MSFWSKRLLFNKGNWVIQGWWGNEIERYIMDSIRCNEIQWVTDRNRNVLVLNIVLSPQMSSTLIVIYRPPSNCIFYEKFETVEKI